MLMNRRLYRCRHDRKIAGVAAGVAEYFELDPTLVRIVWFASIFFGLVTLVLYIGLAFIMPLEPMTAEDEAAHAAAPAASGHQHATRGPGRVTTFIGIVLVLFGSLALVDAVLPSLVSWRYLWPLFIALIGGVLIVGSLRREGNGGIASPTAVASSPEPTTE
jgi:phage shock protein C